MEYLDGCSTALRHVVKRVAALEGRLVWFGGGFTAGTLFRTGRLAYDSTIICAGRISRCLERKHFGKFGRRSARI